MLRSLFGGSSSDQQLANMHMKPETSYSYQSSSAERQPHARKTPSSATTKKRPSASSSTRIASSSTSSRLSSSTARKRTPSNSSSSKHHQRRSKSTRAANTAQSSSSESIHTPQNCNDTQDEKEGVDPWAALTVSALSPAATESTCHDQNVQFVTDGWDNELQLPDDNDNDNDDDECDNQKQCGITTEATPGPLSSRRENSNPHANSVATGIEPPTACMTDIIARVPMPYRLYAVLAYGEGGYGYVP